MKTEIKLIGIDLAIRRIGLGCMGMSEFYGPSDEAETLNVLAKALELGVRLLDTADMYGRGANEELLGRFLKGRRHEAVICTKCGIVRGATPAEQKRDTSPTYIRQACEASLRRLNVETIDLYYLHRIDEVTPIEDSMAELERLRVEGKIRAAGLSEVDTETLRRANTVMPISAVQSEYSLMTRGDEVEAMIDACEVAGAAFVSYSPLSRGLLTGRYRDHATFSPTDFRAHLPRFQPEALENNLGLADLVAIEAEKRGITAAQLALAWVLTRSRNVIAIPGSRHFDRLLENSEAEDVELTACERSLINQLFGSARVAGERYPRFLDPTRNP